MKGSRPVINGQFTGSEAHRAGCISVPVGRCTLGRIFNVLGDPVDGKGPVTSEVRRPIHRSAPSFIELDTKRAIFETGIKVVDGCAPYKRGGKIGLFGGAGVGKTVFIMELINNIAKAHAIGMVTGRCFRSKRLGVSCWTRGYAWRLHLQSVGVGHAHAFEEGGVLLGSVAEALKLLSTPGVWTFSLEHLRTTGLGLPYAR